jgi:hypothetical protein
MRKTIHVFALKNMLPGLCKHAGDSTLWPSLTPALRYGGAKPTGWRECQDHGTPNVPAVDEYQLIVQRGWPGYIPGRPAQPLLGSSSSLPRQG